MPEGFKVNDFDHLEEAKEPGLEHKRDVSGWGFVREDLIKHNVRMLTDIRFIWDENTPLELRKAFAEASNVIHHIAEQAIMNQLKFDGLKPVETRDLLYGEEKDKQVILRDSGWRPIE